MINTHATITHKMNGESLTGLSVDKVVIATALVVLATGFAVAMFGLVVIATGFSVTMMGVVVVATRSTVGLAFCTSLGSLQLLPSALTAHTAILKMKLLLPMSCSNSELFLETGITLTSGSAVLGLRVQGRSVQDLMRISNFSMGRYPEAS